MELVDVGREERRQVQLARDDDGAPGGERAASPLGPDSPRAKALFEQLPALEAAAESFYTWMDGQFIDGEGARARCEDEWFMCGYYLSHRALHVTHFLSAPIGSAEGLARDTALLHAIAAQIDAVMLPKLLAAAADATAREGPGAKGLERECVDLLGELLAIFEFIVFTPAGSAHESALARQDNACAFRRLAKLMQVQPAPTGDCHTAVVYLFSKGALEKWQQGTGAEGIPVGKCD